MRRARALRAVHLGPACRRAHRAARATADCVADCRRFGVGRASAARAVNAARRAPASAYGASRRVFAARRRTPRDRLSVIVAVDRSRSIDLVPGAESRVRAELQVAETGMREDDRIGTLVFG